MNLKQAILTATAILGSPIIVFFAIFNFCYIVFLERSKGEP